MRTWCPGSASSWRRNSVGDVDANVALVRKALRGACDELPAETELQSLRRALLGLAIDADVVLDLHCDNEAVLHLYTATELWPEVEPLARLLGAEVSLLADESGDDPFDEACSTVWPRLAAVLSKASRSGRSSCPPPASAVTVELRGETDVSHELAAADAEALIEYLAVRGFVTRAPAPLPALKRGPTPLAGSIPVVAPHGGVVVCLREPGATVQRGEHIADLVDPLDGGVTRLESPADGVLYARERQRFATAGRRVAKIAGRRGRAQRQAAVRLTRGFSAAGARRDWRPGRGPGPGAPRPAGEPARSARPSRRRPPAATA